MHGQGHQKTQRYEHQRERETDELFSVDFKNQQIHFYLKLITYLKMNFNIPIFIDYVLHFSLNLNHVNVVFFILVKMKMSILNQYGGHIYSWYFSSINNEI